MIRSAPTKQAFGNVRPLAQIQIARNFLASLHLRSSTSATSSRYEIGAEPQPIQIVRPYLHHLFPFNKVRSPVIRSPQRISNRMCELVLDIVWPEAKHFIQDGARHGAKTMANDCAAVKSRISQGGIDRVLAHGP